MNLANIVFDFYREVYAADLHGDGVTIAFNNGIFNNPIMTPNFLVKKEVSRDEIMANQSFLFRKFKRREYWLNCFDGYIGYTGHIENGVKNSDSISDLKLKESMSFQYVVNERKMIEEVPAGLHFEIRERISPGRLREFREMTNLNSFHLDIDTQRKIDEVLCNSNGLTERLLAHDDRGKLIGGYIIIHSCDYSLLINGSISEEHRAKGFFKAMMVKGINHCLDLGKKVTFYWTFNSRLKNNGDMAEGMRIFHG